MRLHRYTRKVMNLLETAFSSSKVSPSVFDNRPNILAGPNRDYTKFILLAHQRSGSELVISSLREHPQVVAFGELFVFRRIGFNIEGYDNHSEVLHQARKLFPVEFLNRFIFSSYLEKKRAVGFKLFPNQLDNHHFRCVWDWIKQNRDIAVICLSRQNHLAAYTSLLIARKTGVYGITDESQRPSITVTINKEKCLSEFRKRDILKAAARKKISNHRVMDITYEELNEDPISTILQIQEFLGIDKVQPEIVTIKKELRPLSEVIANYHEIRQQFAGTIWAHYFDENKHW
jgi:LPS sulfotransferase NodH